VIKTNFFIKTINYLRRLFSIRLHIILHSLTLVSLSIGGCAFIVLVTLNHEINNHANNIGNNLSKQTANIATNMLVSKDILSLNLLVKDLIQNPMISYVAFYDASGKTLAQVGIDNIDNNLVLIQQITLQDNLIGRLNLKLDAKYFASPFEYLLNSLIIIALVMLVVTLIFSYLLGDYILNPISKLTKFPYTEENINAINKRGDEISFLAQSLQQNITSIVNSSLHKQEQANTPPLTSAKTAVLVIKLGAQKQLHKLPPKRLMEILQRYRSLLIQSANLYRGELFKLSEGSNVLLFHSENCGDDYLVAALYCGELLRMLGHELQIELAGTNITLLLSLALTSSDSLHGVTENELLQTKACKQAVELARHSRNLLLLEHEFSNNPYLSNIVKLRNISEPYPCFCVERLLEPHSSFLEKQIFKFNTN